MKIRLSVNNR